MNKLRQQMNRAIDAFVESHYYSEAPEFEGARRAFVQNLCDGMIEVYRLTVLERLQNDPSLVNILLCAGGDIPGAGPWLAARLDGETGTSPLSRALIRVLSDYPGEEACRAVERFLESDQEAESLQSLAHMDWARVRPRLPRAMREPALHSAILRVLHERRKAAGFPALMQEWRKWFSGKTGQECSWARRLLQDTPAPYNPFPPPEIAALLAALPPG